MADLRDLAPQGIWYRFDVGSEDPGILYMTYQNNQLASNDEAVIAAIYNVLDSATALPVAVHKHIDAVTDVTPS